MCFVKYISFYQCVWLHEIADHTPASDNAKEMCPDSGCLCDATTAGGVFCENTAES